MIKLDSIDALLKWLQDVLTEIVKGIKGTYTYWNKRKDDLEDLTKE